MVWRMECKNEERNVTWNNNQFQIIHASDTQLLWKVVRLKHYFHEYEHTPYLYWMTWDMMQKRKKYKVSSVISWGMILDWIQTKGIYCNPFNMISTDTSYWLNFNKYEYSSHLFFRASSSIAQEKSVVTNWVQMSYSGWQWSTHRYSIHDAKPSFSHRCVHHSWYKGSKGVCKHV